MARRTRVVAVLVTCALLVALARLLSDRAPAPPEILRAPEAPPEPPGLQPATPPVPVAAPEAATPAPVPPALPASIAAAEPSPAPAAPVGPPEADGWAMFDDGTAVANARVGLAAAGARMMIANGRTDAGGAFHLTVPGFGRCDVWFEQDGLRFRAVGEIGKGSVVTVATGLLRVRVEPRVPDTSLWIVGLEAPPRSSLVASVTPPEPFTPAYRDRFGMTYPGRRIPVSEDSSTRVPRCEGLLVWASAPGGLASDIRRVDLASDAAVVLRMVGTVQIPVSVVDVTGQGTPSCRLSAFAEGLPAAEAEVLDGKGRFTGLRDGATYSLRCETRSLELASPSAFVADGRRTLDLQVRTWTPTTFRVVDASGRAVEDAEVFLLSDKRLPGDVATARCLGRTGEDGTWTAYSADLGVVDVTVYAPPAPDTVGTWRGRLPTGASHRIELLATLPYTTLVVRPTDCVLYVGRGERGWSVLPTGPIALAQSDAVEVTGGGRYAERWLKAKDFPAGHAELVLQPSVRCRFSTPTEVTRLELRRGIMPIPGLVSTKTGPGEFEVRGFERGTRATACGCAGKPSAARTERVEFVADEGALVLLPALPPVPSSVPAGTR